MQRFRAWAWGIASSSFVIGVALHVFGKVADKIGLYDQPGEAVGTVVRFLRGLAELPWLWNTVLVLGGFVAGMLVDWLLRKLDDSRAYKRRALGYEMLKLGNDLDNRIDSIPQGHPQIMSCLTRARKLGIWAPDQRDIPVDDLFIEYLRTVGTLLRDGLFRKAKRKAKTFA